MALMQNQAYRRNKMYLISIGLNPQSIELCERTGQIKRVALGNTWYKPNNQQRLAQCVLKSAEKKVRDMIPSRLPRWLSFTPVVPYPA